jgi:hypothetical protein
MEVLGFLCLLAALVVVILQSIKFIRTTSHFYTITLIRIRVNVGLCICFLCSIYIYTLFTAVGYTDSVEGKTCTTYPLKRVF